MINQTTIIGLGLIGKSIARAIHHASFTKIIIGYDEDPIKGENLLNEKVLDYFRSDLISAVKNADLIIITVPIDQYESLFKILATNIKPTTTLTDISSIKLPILQIAQRTLGEHFAHFVPSHPIIRFDNKNTSIPDLFAERPIILTPSEETNDKSLNLVTKLWQKMGGEIDIKTAADNDAILATVSHLPQILAFTFINSLNDEKALRYITKNFIDFTSIATQCPEAWSDICIANRQAILKELSKFELNLKKLKKILESENAEILLEHFSNAKQVRENI